MKTRFALPIAALAALTIGGSASAALITGTFTGTVQAGYGVDTLGIFAAPGTDLAGQTVTGSFAYDTAGFVNTAPGIPGFANYQAANAGAITETIDGTTLVVGSSNYFALVFETQPYGLNDVYEISASDALPANALPGDDLEYNYTIMAWGSSIPFLHGIDPNQSISVVGGAAGSAIEIEHYSNYNPTSGYTISSELIGFNVNVAAAAPSTPEPGTVWLGIFGIAAAAAPRFLRRARRS